MSLAALPGTPYAPLAAWLSFPFPAPSASCPDARTLMPEAICALLDSWGTAPIAAFNLHHYHGPLPPNLAGVRDLLTHRRELPMAMANLLRWERGARAACTVLADADLPRPLALKGGASRYIDYPHPHLRTASDLDLLLPRHEVERGVDALRSAGFSLCITDPRRRHTAREGHHVMLKHEDTLVELHRSIDYHDHPLVRYDALVPRARGLPQLHPWLLAPSPEDALLIAAAHCLKHGMLVPLRSLVDVQLALLRPELDEALLLQRARDTKLLGVLAQTASQCGQLAQHEGALHRRLSQFLSPLAARLFPPGYVGGNGLPDGPSRKLLAHAVLTPGWQMTGRLISRFTTRRALDFLRRG